MAHATFWIWSTEIRNLNYETLPPRVRIPRGTPETLTPQPQTLNHVCSDTNYETRNPPKPESRISKHEARNTKHETRNTKHETRNGVRNPLCLSLEAREVTSIPLASRRALPTETKVESGTSQSKSGTSVNFMQQWKPQINPSATRNTKHETRNTKLETRDTKHCRKHETRNKKHETRNTEP